MSRKISIVLPTAVLILAALVAPVMAQSRGSHLVQHDRPIVAASIPAQTRPYPFAKRGGAFGSFATQLGPRMMQWRRNNAYGTRAETPGFHTPDYSAAR
jgi:hypothetical protein